MGSIRYGNRDFEKLIVRKQKAIRKEVRQAARDTGTDLANWLTIAVREWTHRPRFAGRVTIQPDYIEVKVDVAGSAKQIFFYVDKGTGLYGPKKQAYEIKPKQPGGMLRFQPGYSARSQPGAKIGMGTGEHFGEWISKKSVMHPGIKAREFEKKAMDELTPDFFERIAIAIAAGVAA